MEVKGIARAAAIALLAIGINGCSTTSAVSMMQQLGGAETVTKLAGSFLQSAVTNPQLSSLLSGVDMSAITPKVSDQLCSMLGGGCAAPLTADQIKAGAAKVNPQQASALSSAFSSALDVVKASPELQQGITKLVGPQLGGIVGALL
jgi:truncated hemoglobin YjbI